MVKGQFSKQLQTTKRKWLTELRESDAGCGSWNADATISDRPMGDFTEVVNMRKMKPGELEVRSGYRQWSPFSPTHGVTGVPVWKAEYRLDEVFVDITLFVQEHTGDLWAFILHPEIPDSQPQLQKQLVRICQVQDPGNPSLTDRLPVVCAYQFQTWLMISVITTDPAIVDPNDTTVWALQPDDLTLTTWIGPNALRPVGKDMSPTPQGFTFPLTATGKLYVYRPSAAAIPQMGYDYDAITGEAITSAMDIQAPYFIADNSTPNQPLWGTQTPIVKRWTRNKNDAPATSSLDSVRHVKSRGWWYRVVLKRKFMDARGQDHVISEAPSADFYVEEKNYTPPTTVAIGSGGKLRLTDAIMTFHADGDRSGWATASTDIVGSDLTQTGIADVANNGVNLNSWPNESAWQLLQHKFRGVVPAPGDQTDPYFFASVWLGWVPASNVTIFNGALNGTDGFPPYKLEVGAHEMNGSPNAIFTWANFGLDPTIDTTLYAIDFYRTAYSYPDEKDNAVRDPLWGTAYNYGYAGTLHSGDTSFTDNIADDGLLGGSPLDADGFLIGQFAGEVMRPYQDQLVLGNIRQKYQVRSPWSGIQSFAYLSPDLSQPLNYYFNDIVIPPVGTTDGLPFVQFYYQYKDRDGNQSDCVPITVLQDYDDHVTSGLNVAFLFPRGYSDRIVSAVLIQSIWDTNLAKRRYFTETTVSLSTGTYFSAHRAVDPNSGLTTLPELPGLPTHNIKLDTSPGYVMWSKVNNAWEWPIENIENETDQDPITALDEVIGPLYCFSDRGIVMTRLNGYREPVQTSSVTSGCISRYACIKVDQVVFTMTANGLIFTGGSGVVPFGANVLTEIQKRLREEIPSQPSLYGTRNRVSMSYLALRSELWIHFPSTIELGGQFAARTFILKFLDPEKTSFYGHANYYQHSNAHAYEFEIAKPNPTGLVIMLPHADGKMFCSYYDPGDNGAHGNPVRIANLIVQNNDDPSRVWPGDWAFQYQHGMGTPNVAKIIYQVNFLAEMNANVYIQTGMGREDGLYDRLSGTINPLSPLRQIVPLNNGVSSEYRLPVSGSVIETSGTPPAFRIYGTPTSVVGSAMENWFKIESFDIYFGFLAQHKGD